MRWFWQRRRQRQSAVAAPLPTPTRVDTVQRAPTTSGRIGQPRQLTSDLLMLARDYFQSIGGRVRVEDEDVLSATLKDGSLIRYTTSLAKARSDESMTLLVEGSGRDCHRAGASGVALADTWPALCAGGATGRVDCRRTCLSRGRARSPGAPGCVDATGDQHRIWPASTGAIRYGAGIRSA
jgi:hypothetical protein